MRGVILAVALTHWPKLALILCAEARRIACSDYVVLARCQGMGRCVAGASTCCRGCCPSGLLAPC